MVSESCSWCHETVPVEVRLCPVCGHEAHQARMSCCCDRCRRRLELPARLSQAVWEQRGAARDAFLRRLEEEGR